jgi:hypothetical protein
MRDTLLVIAVGAVCIAGCGGTPSCEEAVHKASARIPQLASLAETSQAVAQCIKDQWPAELRTCVAGARDQPELGACMMRRAPHAPQGMGASKAELAKVKAKKYALEAYPQWLAAHPDKACPDRLEELNEYMTDNDTLDPWGRPYRMMCGPTVAGAKGLAVVSAGEDGKGGTADDIKSWE